MKYTPPLDKSGDASYVNFNPVMGVEGSTVPAAAIEHPQREIINVIEMLGGLPNENQLDQMATLLKAALSGKMDIGDIEALIFATDVEIKEGTVTDKPISPKGLTARLATTAIAGLIQLATAQEVKAGTIDNKAITPATLKIMNATITESGLVKKATDEEVKDKSGDGVVSAGQLKFLDLLPPGFILPYAATIPPDGFLTCDGSAISRTIYSNLFDIIGTVFGQGNGSTTFTLPDLRGDFIRGWDKGRGVDVGRAFGSFQADAFRNHSHDIYALNARNDTWNEALNNAAAKVPGEDTGGGVWYSGKIAATGGNESRPRNMALLFCIKY